MADESASARDFVTNWIAGYVISMTEKDHASVLAPPPLLTIVAIAAGFLANHYLPLVMIPEGIPHRRLLAALLLLTGFASGLAAISQLVRHKEHPSPYEATHTIVDGGIYRFTRNPIYLGFMLFATATVVSTNSFWLLIAAVILFLTLHFGVIRPEERYLARKFGESYQNYCQRVRRWI